MASPAPRLPSASPPARRRASVWRACVLAAAAISVAGCVAMPSSGPVGAITATPQSTAANGTDFIQPLPAGPYAGETPAGIVQGFLTASASYPVNGAVARQYLTSSVSHGWNPGWQVTVFSRFNPTEVAITPPVNHASRVAVVGVSGDVQSTFNGSGQFVSAGSQADTQGAWQFTLTKVNGQWRISKPPPPRRLLTVPQFQDFYKAQELYFINPSVPASAAQQPLVPDSVFVPLGTSTTDLVNNLVNALLPTANGEPKSSLLQQAADTFPAGTKLAGVTQTGSTAVVNLDGLARTSTTVKEQVSAQLVWTLASPRAGPPQAIQSVQLEINGSPWTPPRTICGIAQRRSPVQNQATYPCYNPYPSQPANFSFTSQGQVWSRCGSEASVQGGFIGPVLSDFRPAGAASLAGCDSSGAVHTSSPSKPAPVQVPGVGTPTLAAVSPDGQYLAVYSPGNPAGQELSIGLLSSDGRLDHVPGIGSGVTAISWDRSQDLWVAENGDVFMVPVDGNAVQVNTVPPDVTDLSVAPDGFGSPSSRRACPAARLTSRRSSMPASRRRVGWDRPLPRCPSASPCKSGPASSSRGR